MTNIRIIAIISYSTMSHEIISPAGPEFCSDAAARDEYIFGITGIQPDSRTKVPLEETRQMIRGVQAGDAEAMENLIATRLRWIYDKYSQKDVIKGRFDLEMADIMQMGSLATLEAARTVDANAPDVNILLYMKTPTILGGMITRSKLLPTISPDGHKLVNVRYGHHEERMAEDIVPVGGSADVAAVNARNRTVATVTPTEIAEADEFNEVLNKSLAALSETECYVIDARFGVGAFSGREPMSLREAGEGLGVSHEIVRRIQVVAMRKLIHAWTEISEGPEPR